jgi:hypothetical protein
MWWTKWLADKIIPATKAEVRRGVKDVAHYPGLAGMGGRMTRAPIVNPQLRYTPKKSTPAALPARNDAVLPAPKKRK